MSMVQTRDSSEDRETTEWSAVTVHIDLPPPHSLQELYIYYLICEKREGEKYAGAPKSWFRAVVLALELPLIFHLIETREKIGVIGAREEDQRVLRRGHVILGHAVGRGGGLTVGQEVITGERAQLDGLPGRGPHEDATDPNDVRVR